MPGKGGDTRSGRPVKGASDRKRREKVQRLRLIGLGMAEDKVKKLNTSEVRQLIKAPAKLKKSLANQKKSLANQKKNLAKK